MPTNFNRLDDKLAQWSIGEGLVRGRETGFGGHCDRKCSARRKAPWSGRDHGADRALSQFQGGSRRRGRRSGQCPTAIRVALTGGLNRSATGPEAHAGTRASSAQRRHGAIGAPAGSPLNRAVGRNLDRVHAAADMGHHAYIVARRAQRIGQVGQTRLVL